MEDKRTLEEIHASLCDNMKRMYAEKGEQITDQEAWKAANNLLQFCEKVVEIRSRDTNE